MHSIDELKNMQAKFVQAGTDVRAVCGVGLRPLARCVCGFEIRWGHGCLSCVMCCQVEVSAQS
jgi:hypothetical protein